MTTSSAPALTFAADAVQTPSTSTYTSETTSRKVAIALDSSTCSVEALQWSLSNVLTSSDEVILIHVLDYRPIRLPDPYRRTSKSFGYASMDDLNKDIAKLHNKKAQEMMREYCKMCLKKDIDPEFKILDGSVKGTLCSFAAENKIDLVAMGNRGLGTTSRMFLGSISDYCVHNMPCPVLVVKCSHECNKKI